ncbi:MAG: FKBP-type peptidyl-prolyl cis-trans isomerase [Chloroflexota bacterium]
MAASWARTPALLAVLACAGLLVSCGGGGSSPFGSDSIVLQGEGGRPDVPIPVGPPPKKLVVVDLKKGSGRAARKGDELRVRYFNLAYRGHQIYEDNWDTTFGPFELGAGQVVESWDEGLPGIKAGTRRVLVVPGGRETFTRKPEIYVVEAISVVPSKHPTVAVQVTEKVKPTGAKPAIAHDLGPPPTKLVVRTLKSGEGHRVRRGERLGVRFMDVSYRTRNTQDFWGEEGDEEPPYHFVLGQGRVRKGWEIAIPGKRLGTRLELLLPSRLAYGEGPMRYVVELIDRTEPSPDHAE